MQGDGAAFSKNDLLEEARKGTYQWEHQDGAPGSQTVRVWGDTSVVTAEL